MKTDLKTSKGVFHESGFVFIIIHVVANTIQPIPFRCFLYKTKNKPKIKDEKIALVEHITLLSH